MTNFREFLEKTQYLMNTLNVLRIIHHTPTIGLPRRCLLDLVSVKIVISKYFKVKRFRKKTSLAEKVPHITHNSKTGRFLDENVKTATLLRATPVFIHSDPTFSIVTRFLARVTRTFQF